jgi:hypothetical protein
VATIEQRLAVSFAVAAHLLPGQRLWNVTGLAEVTRQTVIRIFVGVEVRGFEPLTSSVRERTGVVPGPALLTEEGR